MPTMPTLRPLPLLIALLCLPMAPRASDGAALPEIGSSAQQLISPAQEAEYGRQMLGELRRLGYLLEDPLLEEWIADLGHRLAARSERPEQTFRFFLMRSREINAFATLGGHVGMNAGLVLTAEREDEVAAVMAHEVSHATQRHIVRSVEAAQKDTLPIMLAMLGAIAIAQQSGGDADATQAAIAGGMALAQQRQINFTRANEHEADRVGIQILARTGYDPMAMADFFGRMQRATRSQGDSTPDFLRTHPVTTTRISEAKDRARALAGESISGAGGNSASPLNPVIPGNVHQALTVAQGPDALGFDLARERMRVISAASPAAAVAEYRRTEEGGSALSDAQRYGMALAQMQLGDAGVALQVFEALGEAHPSIYWFGLAVAEALHHSGDDAATDAAYARLLDRQPRNRAIALSYADVLAQRGSRESGLAAQAVLRPLLAENLYDPALHTAFARACELGGDTARAAEAYAEAAFLSGRAEDALNQLVQLKEREDIDYVQRARIDARIAEMTPIVLELRKQGIGPGDADRERSISDVEAHALRLR